MRRFVLIEWSRTCDFLLSGGQEDIDEKQEDATFVWLRCHKEIDGTVGTYPYRKISDEFQKILRDHGFGAVEVHRIGSTRVTTAGNRRRLPSGNVVWLDREVPAPWKPTDTLFSLNYPYHWGEALYTRICMYFASIPDLLGRWELEIIDSDTGIDWKISVNEATYEFISDHWSIVPDSDPMFLSECTAEQVKEWLLDRYKWKQRNRKTVKHTYSPPREKWLYEEEGIVIQDFSEKSALAHYIYTSNIPKDGMVRLVMEDDLLEEDLSTSVNETAKQFLARYERFHPLFPPRDHEIPKRLRETRFILNGEKCTARDMWERSYRSQIDNLIRSGGENHIAALVLMMPCMDMVYKLKTGDPKSGWTEVMKMFFPAFGFSDATYHQLRELVRNGFVHDGIAGGNVGISTAQHTSEEYSDSKQVFQGLRTATGEFKLLIVPAFFWARVRNKIDTFYKYEQWIPGWDMPQVLTISHYIEPLSREEIT